MGRGRRPTRTREAAASHCGCVCIIHVCLDKPEKKRDVRDEGEGTAMLFFSSSSSLAVFHCSAFPLTRSPLFFFPFFFVVVDAFFSVGGPFISRFLRTSLSLSFFTLPLACFFCFFLFLFPLFLIHVHTHHHHHPPLPLPCCPLFYVVALFEDEEIQERGGGGGVHVIEEQEAIWSRLEGGWKKTNKLPSADPTEGRGGTV